MALKLSNLLINSSVCWFDLGTRVYMAEAEWKWVFLAHLVTEIWNFLLLFFKPVRLSLCRKLFLI